MSTEKVIRFVILGHLELAAKSSRYVLMIPLISSWMVVVNCSISILRAASGSLTKPDMVRNDALCSEESICLPRIWFVSEPIIKE